MLRTLPLLLLVACGDNAALHPDAAAPEPDAAAPPTAVLDASCQGAAGAPRVIVYSAENLWNHESNPVAQRALLDMCSTRGFSVIATHDGTVFHDGHLDAADVVVFAVTSGPVMDDAAKSAFEAWLSRGHGMVGIHSASATDLEFPFFVQALGAQFLGHGLGLPTGTLLVDPGNAITASYPAMTTRSDEWYSFTAHPEDDAGTHVMAWLDETTLPADYLPSLLMGHHAIAWTHEGYGGRTFYTALGHTVETYREQPFLDMLGNAIAWAAGRTD